MCKVSVKKLGIVLILKVMINIIVYVNFGIVCKKVIKVWIDNFNQDGFWVLFVVKKVRVIVIIIDKIVDVIVNCSVF